MKKGFTLIELMGVIVILGIVVLLAVPTIRKVIKGSKEDLYNVQINNIEDALKNWAIDNNQVLPKTEGEKVTITLGQLKIGGYIDSEITNPITNKCFANDMDLIITRYQENYTYTADTESGIEDGNCLNYNKLYVTLKGGSVLYIEYGTEYNEPGIIAKDENGNDISNNATIVISGSGDTIDTSVVGNKYVITYTVTSGSKTETVKRNIIVRDSEAPILIVPENVALGTNETSFDVMAGVSATDNSGETINVNVKSNISFGIPGEYIITYTAKDSSGNTTVKKRKVTINKTVIDPNSLKALATTSTEVTSIPTCVTDGTKCAEGTAVAIKVNDDEIYNFYVMKDDGTEVILIMDRNIGTQVAWISKDDYILADGNETEYGTRGSSSKGPITVLNYLNEETKTWTNILPIKSYKYTNNENGTTIKYGYQKLTITNGLGVLTSQDGTTTNLAGIMRTRLITYSEIIALTDQTKTWLYGNLSSSNTTESPIGYWLLTTYKNENGYSHYMFHSGTFTYDRAVSDNKNCGARPVITISK